MLAATSAVRSRTSSSLLVCRSIRLSLVRSGGFANSIRRERPSSFRVGAHLRSDLLAEPFKEGMSHHSFGRLCPRCPCMRSAWRRGASFGSVALAAFADQQWRRCRGHSRLRKRVKKDLRSAAGDRGASSIPVLGDSLVYCWQRERTGFDPQAGFVLDRQIEEPLLGEGVSFICQLTYQTRLRTTGRRVRTNWLRAPIRRSLRRSQFDHGSAAEQPAEHGRSLVEHERECVCKYQRSAAVSISHLNVQPRWPKHRFQLRHPRAGEAAL
ncbi:hypothetical protein ABID65_008557 [Bradyrhizobium sp. S3.9.2]